MSALLLSAILTAAAFLAGVILGYFVGLHHGAQLERDSARRYVRRVLFGSRTQPEP